MATRGSLKLLLYLHYTPNVSLSYDNDSVCISLVVQQSLNCEVSVSLWCVWECLCATWGVLHCFLNVCCCNVPVFCPIL